MHDLNSTDDRSTQSVKEVGAQVGVGRRLILVTGLPRSGTTLVGDILASAKKTTSLYEPMNFQSGDVRFPSNFPICGTEEFSQSQFEEFLCDLKNLRLSLRTGLFPHDRGLKAFAKYFTGGRSRTSYRKSRLSPLAKTIIWKDPFAVFCQEEAIQAGIDVVVTYRPPHAIAASYKRLNWTYDIAGLKQRLAETSWGSAILDADETARPSDVSREVHGAVSLWKASCRVLLKQAETCNTVRVIDTGGLPSSYESVLPRLFRELSLQATAKTDRLVEKRFTSVGSKNAVPQGHPHTRRRDVHSVNSYWKQVLSEEEANYIDVQCSEMETDLVSKDLFLHL